MNKIITSTSLLGICLLSCCSTIKGFRQDPSTWGKKEEIKKISTKTNPPKNKPVRRIQSNISENTNVPSINNKVNNTSNNTTKKGRTVKGMMEPNVTRLPDNKDLQESNTVVPVPAPLKPKLNLGAPVNPLPKVPAE